MRTYSIPIFFLHHCYLDLLWERWRLQHPNVESFSQQPDEADMNETLLVFNPVNQPAPWTQTYTVRQTLLTENLDYRYADL